MDCSLLANGTVQSALFSATTACATVQPFPTSAPPPGEALVRVRLAGICNTDLELVRGYLNFRGTLGHEFVGEVWSGPPMQRGSASAWWGTSTPPAAARYQRPAPPARPTHCPNRTTLGVWVSDGAFADYLILPQANLYAVPENVSDEMAVFTEPLAAACGILAQSGSHLPIGWLC